MTSVTFFWKDRYVAVQNLHARGKASGTQKSGYLKYLGASDFNRIDAAFSDRKGRPWVYLVSGSSYRLFNNDPGVGKGITEVFPLSNWGTGERKLDGLIQGRLQAALHHGNDARYTYFFWNGKYVRYDWTDGTLADTDDTPSWKLPAKFNGAALRGAVNVREVEQGQQLRIGFFFSGKEYIRYNWRDPNKPIWDGGLIKSLGVKIDGAPLEEIDAVVDGFLQPRTQTGAVAAGPKPNTAVNPNDLVAQIRADIATLRALAQGLNAVLNQANKYMLQRLACLGVATALQQYAEVCTDKRVQPATIDIVTPKLGDIKQVRDSLQKAVNEIDLTRQEPVTEKVPGTPFIVTSESPGELLGRWTTTLAALRERLLESKEHANRLQKFCQLHANDGHKKIPGSEDIWRQYDAAATEAMSALGNYHGGDAELAVLTRMLQRSSDPKDFTELGKYQTVAEILEANRSNLVGLYPQFLGNAAGPPSLLVAAKQLYLAIHLKLNAGSAEKLAAAENVLVAAFKKSLAHEESLKNEVIKAVQNRDHGWIAKNRSKLVAAQTNKTQASVGWKTSVAVSQLLVVLVSLGDAWSKHSKGELKVYDLVTGLAQTYVAVGTSVVAAADAANSSVRLADFVARIAKMTNEQVTRELGTLGSFFGLAGGLITMAMAAANLGNLLFGEGQTDTSRGAKILGNSLQFVGGAALCVGAVFQLAGASTVSVAAFTGIGIVLVLAGAAVLAVIELDAMMWPPNQVFHGLLGRLQTDAFFTKVVAEKGYAELKDNVERLTKYFRDRPNQVAKVPRYPSLVARLQRTGFSPKEIDMIFQPNLEVEFIPLG